MAALRRTLRTCAALLAAATMLAVPSARAADWIKVVETTDLYALDLASAEKLPGRKLRIWVKRILPKPQDFGASLGIVVEIEKMYMDCTTTAAVVVEVKAYDAAGVLQGGDVMPDQAPPLGAGDPLSNGGKVASAACNYVYGKPPRSFPVDYRLRASAAWNKLSYLNATTSYFAESEVRLGNGQGGENIVSYPVRLDWDTPRGSSPGLSSVVIQYATDCRDFSTMETSSAWFDRNGEFLFREDVEIAKLKLTPMTPGTVGQTAALRACAQRLVLSKTPAAPADRPPPTATASPQEKGEGKSRMGTGTGWHVGNGLLVTAAHVVNDARSISVIGQDGKRHPARVLQFDDKNDVAVLSVGEAGRAWRAVALARAPAQLGAHVMTIGFPFLPELGTSPKVTSGEISSTQGMQNDPTVYQISAPIQPGNSGGPLFNMYGEVVGMVVFKLDEAYAMKELGTLPQNIGYAVKTRYIEVLLEEANRGALPPRTGSRRELRAEELAGQNRDAVFIILATLPPKQERAAGR